MDDVPTLIAAELEAWLARAQGPSAADPAAFWKPALAAVWRQALAQLAEVERLNSDIGRLRCLCMELEVARDERDAYRADLEEIGRLVGCGHVEDGLARCVRDALEKAKE